MIQQAHASPATALPFGEVQLDHQLSRHSASPGNSVFTVCLMLIQSSFIHVPAILLNYTDIFK